MEFKDWKTADDWAAAIKEARLERGWTQEQAAKRIGIHFVQYNAYENRRSFPTVFTKKCVEEALGMEAKILFRVKDE